MTIRFTILSFTVLTGLFLLIGCTNEESKPLHATIPSGLHVDRCEVSIAEFAEFVHTSEYITTCDSLGWGAVFDYERGIWTTEDRANWKRPNGKLAYDFDLPVTQVSFKDACAYCDWKKGRLPSADEWDMMMTKRTAIGNIWEGVFPLDDSGEDGYVSRAAPVGSFRANSFGLHDLRGNVWEWTSSKTDSVHYIIKGGSFLCADNYCRGYNAEEFQTTGYDSGLNHLGFRCVYD